MFKRLLTPSLIILLSITLVSCTATKKKKTPGGTVIGDNGDEVDDDSDLAVLIKDYERVEADPANTTLFGYTQLDATDSSLNVPEVRIYTKDATDWKTGWTMTIPADISKIKTLYYYAQGKFDSDNKDNVAPGYIGRVSFDQDGKQISPLVDPKATDRLITNGKHTEALYPETQLDFNKVTKFFRVLLYDNDKVPGKKGQYFLFPPLYLTHK